MKKTLAIGGKLALICAISAILLAFVNSITEPAIREYKRKTLLEGLKAVAGGGEIGEENLVEDNPAVKGYYPLVFPDGGSGYILRLIGSGYGGDMLILSGFR
ncbi:MAG: FMN-binding protein, partial [Spirochaetales bacterium]